jgi:hypothetical protein
MSKKIARGLYFSTSLLPAPFTALRRAAHEFPTLLSLAPIPAMNASVRASFLNMAWISPC